MLSYAEIVHFEPVAQIDKHPPSVVRVREQDCVFDLQLMPNHYLLLITEGAQAVCTPVSFMRSSHDVEMSRAAFHSTKVSRTSASIVFALLDTWVFSLTSAERD
jgi:hypothetical protein